MKKIIAATAVGLLTLSGCAYNYVVPVTDENRNTSGVRVYGTKPLLVVSGGEVQVQFVPNYSKEYAVKFGAFLASNDVTVTLTAAQTLTSIAAKPNGVELISGILDFAEAAAEEGSKSLAGALFSGTTTGGSVQIYDIVFNEDGSIKELRPLIDPGAHFAKVGTGALPQNPGTPAVPLPQ